VSDIFREVDEEVRRERLEQLWKRYGSYITAAALVVVACVGAWRGYLYWEERKAAEAGAAYEAASGLADAGKHSEAEAAFAKLASEGTAQQVLDVALAFHQMRQMILGAPRSCSGNVTRRYLALAFAKRHSSA